ncbi:MAG: hypothetical protein C0445_14105 [Polaromonas sp.]|nr:hypothetical protein [Polaromonas sp.]
MRTDTNSPTPTRNLSRALALAAAHARALASVALGWAALHSASSWAHDGHGLPGSHWHASDTLGLLVGGVAVAAVWFWKGRP